MFNYIFISILLLLGVVGYNLPTHDPKMIEGCHLFSFIIWGVSFIWSMAAMINSLTERIASLKKFEEIRGYISNYANYKKVKKELVEMLEKFLGTEYPKHEKEVISGMGSATGIMVQYPELATSNTFIKLTNDLSSAIHNLDNMRRNIINECATIRGKLQSGWVWFKPLFPSDIQEKIENADF